MARPSVYKGADGKYHVYVTVGKKANGQLDRRHREAKTRAQVLAKLEKLEEKLRAGHVPGTGAGMTVAAWMEHWLTVIAPRRVRATTLQGYESKVRHRIIPGLGGHRLDKLTPDQVERYFAKLETEVSSATALQAFRILSRALKVAEQRGLITRNPCNLVDKPSLERDERDPLTEDEEIRVLAAAAAAGVLLRWLIAFVLGLRQGEALGLDWDSVVLDGPTPHARVRQELVRLKWRHGCEETCGRRAASCPKRHGGGLVLTEVKSRKSRRTLPLPPVLVKLLRDHRQAQLKQRLALGALWREHGLVFVGPQGQPVNHRADWGQWKDLLKAAGVRDVRVHDARHGAGTAMRVAGMDLRQVMEWLGHSQISVTTNYAHVPGEEMRRWAKQLDRRARRIGSTQVQRKGATDRRRRSS